MMNRTRLVVTTQNTAVPATMPMNTPTHADTLLIYHGYISSN